MVSLNPTAESVRIAQQIIAVMEEDRRLSNETREYFKGRKPRTQREWDAVVHLGTTSLTDEVFKQWYTIGKQVLSIHPELVETIKFARSSRIEPEVFKALPYLNPMVVFPEPLTVTAWNNEEVFKALGFFTFGKLSVTAISQDGTLVPHARAEDLQGVVLGDGRMVVDSGSIGNPISDTHDPDSIAFGVCVVTEVTDLKNGAYKGIEFERLSFPFSHKPFTIDEAVEEQLRKFTWETHGVPLPADERGARVEFMRGLIKVVLGSIMYLCSTTLDAEQVPKKFVAKQRKGVHRRPFSLYKVGWQIGAALSALRREVDTGENPSSQEKGYEQDPQHRKAHIKTVWTGPGRTIPRTAFVGPYWTHLEKLANYHVRTVRGVKA